MKNECEVAQLTCPECAAAISIESTRCPYCGFELMFKFVAVKLTRDIYPRVVRVPGLREFPVDIVHLSFTMQYRMDMKDELKTSSSLFDHVVRVLLPFNIRDRIVRDVKTDKYVDEHAAVIGTDPLHINNVTLYHWIDAADRTVNIMSTYLCLAAPHPEIDDMLREVNRYPLDFSHREFIMVRFPTPTAETKEMLARHMQGMGGVSW